MKGGLFTKIISMHIYGFGQLTNVKIDNLSDFHVFYGENEAGKSTIMAFIHGILFGFPTKQQSELRYEPKHHNSYGGKLKIFSEETGFAVIERVKGKAAAGDVKVIAEAGLTGGEELLKKLLSNVDKGLFQAIFSFNLHGLQNIHQMKGEDIGKFIFSAGTLGTDRLAIADGELQRELDNRFKPGGKKPYLNEKLQALNRLHRELRDASVKNEEYESLVQQKGEIQNKMEEISHQLEKLQEQMNIMNEWNKIEPLVKEEKWTKQELSLLGEVSFPQRGIERFENLKPLIASTEAQSSSLNERLSRLKKELETITPHQHILESESEILAVLERYPLYSQWKSQEEQGKIMLHQYDEQLTEIKDKLHLELAEDEICSINTNIFMRDSAEKLSRRGQALEDVNYQLEKRFNEEKDILETIEEDIRIIKAKVLPVPEKETLEKQVNGGMERNNLEMKIQTVRDKIEIYKRADLKEKKAAARFKKQKQMQYSLFAVLFLGIVFYGLYSSQTILLILGGIGFIVVLLLLLGSVKQSERNKENDILAELYQEEQGILRQLQSSNFVKIAELKEKLDMDNRHCEKLKILEIKLQEQQNQYEKVIKRFEEWELENVEYKEAVKKLTRQLKIPDYMANSFLMEAFALIEQYKHIARDKQQLEENINILQDNQSEFLDKIKLFAEKFISATNTDLQNSVYLLKNKLKEEQEKNIQWKEKQVKLNELQADLEQLNEENRHLAAELNKLMTMAAVKNESEFYDMGVKDEKRRKLKERLEDLEKQLHYSFLSELERESCLQIHNCDEITNSHRQEASNLQSRLTSLQEQHASIKYKIQILEEGGLYSELLHQFKEKKYELEEGAKEWAVFSLAQHILSQTVEKYKNAHLPKMLLKAEEFLSCLTDGNYQKILLHQSRPGFLIVRKDQTIFEANELSQATAEQVYVSIRLALALTIYEKYHFPIIIDDSFVNFDSKRTQKVIDLLKLLQQNQILFFTCHEHLLSSFEKENILYLKNGAIQVI